MDSDLNHHSHERGKTTVNGPQSQDNQDSPDEPMLAPEHRARDDEPSAQDYINAEAPSDASLDRSRDIP